MKKIIVFVALPLIAGCLTASNPGISFWPLEYSGKVVKDAVKPTYGVARLASVVVRSPYNERCIAVLRANGSIAFDDYNEYAASPSLLAKGLVMDAMRSSGKFSAVIGSESTVRNDVLVEVMITRLALDCRESDHRQAVAEVIVRLVKSGNLMTMGKGEAMVDAADGIYGAAFGAAISEALDAAMGQFK